MRTLLASVGLLMAITVPAKADRPVSPAELARLAPAVATQACSNGEMQ